MYNETREATGTLGLVKKSLLDMAIEQGLNVLETDFTYEEIQILSYAFRNFDVRQVLMTQVSGRGGLEGTGHTNKDGEEIGVYFFRPVAHHKLTDIITRAEKKAEL